MDKSKLIEDLITTRLLSGDVMDFITELKQANVTPTEARTADLFGEPELGELVAKVIENIDNQDALTPAITELKDALSKSGAVTSSKGESKENFAMDRDDLEKKIESEVEEPVLKDGKDDSTITIDERVSRIEESLAKFSVVADQVQKISDFMFAETEDEAEEEAEDASDEDDAEEMNACDSKVSFSEDGQVTITMSTASYEQLRKSMANIRNFAEEHEEEPEEQMISIPKSEYKQLMYDLGKAEARADEDSAKAYEENPTQDLTTSEDACPECDDAHDADEKHEDLAEDEEVKFDPEDYKAMKKELAELRAAYDSLKNEEKKVDAAEDPEAENLEKEEKPAEEPAEAKTEDAPKLSDEEKEALKDEIKEEVKEDVKEELISQKAAKPEDLSDDEKSALESNFSEQPIQNDTYNWLFG